MPPSEIKSLEVLLAPAEFEALKRRDLSETVCVVFDVLRATSSMVTALGNGAAAIVPVEEIEEALAVRKKDPGVLLAGERDGLLIDSRLAGGVKFDLGNSPREFTREKVQGKTLAMTTTNGTRALRACVSARMTLIGSFLNLRGTADFLRATAPGRLLMVCGGTFDQAAYEDILAAGALCESLWPEFEGGNISDSALLARQLYQLGSRDLLGCLSQARNGRRLLSRPELRDDVALCARLDTTPLVAELGKDGYVRRLAKGQEGKR